MVSQLKVNEIIKQSGSSITIGESGDSITFPSTGTTSGIYTNTPSWRAQIASQSLSFNTTTKIDYTSELQDTNTAYDTSNKRFTVPTGLGGTYMIGSWYRIGSSTDVEAFTIIPYVNGAALDSNRQLRSSMVQRNNNTIQMSGTIELSAADYLEMYALNADSNATYTIGYDNAGLFWGFKLIGA